MSELKMSMKLSEWIRENDIPNNRILEVLEYYESIKRYVAYKYGLSEKELKEYHWRFKRRDANGKRREETPIVKTNEQGTVVDIFALD